jgi:hypothetical protein
MPKDCSEEEFKLRRAETTKAVVPKYFQARMPYGLGVPKR